jgi:hypothetical protein
MPSALMLDDEKKLAGRIRTNLRSARINLTSTEETETFLKTLAKNRPDIVLMSYWKFGCRVNYLKTFVNKVRRAAPRVPALLLVPGKRPPADWKEIKRLFEGKLFDCVRCEASGYIEEMTFRTERLLDSAKSKSGRVKQSKRSRANQSAFFKHLVPEVHDPKTGRIDATKLSQMLGIPVKRIAEIVNAKPATVHKTPTAPALQEQLGEFERIVAALLQLTGSRENLRMWLNASNSEFGGSTPLELILTGKSEVVRNLLEDTLLGQPA